MATKYQTMPHFSSNLTFPAEAHISCYDKHVPHSLSDDKSETIASRPLSSKRKAIYIKTKAVCKELLKKYWFLLGLLFVIILAWKFPDVARKGGYVRAEWSIKWGKFLFVAIERRSLHFCIFSKFNDYFATSGAVIVIFFISGLSLRTRTLAQTILRIRLHILIQVINLVIIPFFVFGLVLVFFYLRMSINSLLLIGVVIAASTPTTVSSNVVMTKNANGNEASGKSVEAQIYINEIERKSNNSHGIGK